MDSAMRIDIDLAFELAQGIEEYLDHEASPWEALIALELNRQSLNQRGYLFANREDFAVFVGGLLHKRQLTNRV